MPRVSDRDFGLPEFCANTGCKIIHRIDTLCVPLVPARAVDMINEPPHYRGAVFKGLPIEPADVVEAFGLHANHFLATVFYYIVRAGKKGPAIDDLKKARWFLEREIARIEKK